MWPPVLKEVELTIICIPWTLAWESCAPQPWPQDLFILYSIAYAWCPDPEEVAKKSDIWNGNSVSVLNCRSGLSALLKNAIYISKVLPGLLHLLFLTSGSCIIVGWSEPCFGHLMTRPEARFNWSNFTPSVRFSRRLQQRKGRGLRKEKGRNTVEHVVYKCAAVIKEKNHSL